MTNRYYCDVIKLKAPFNNGKKLSDCLPVLDYKFKQKQHKDLQFIIRLTKSDVLKSGCAENISSIVADLLNEGISLDKLSVVVDNETNYVYTSQEWKQIVAINKYLQNKNIKFGFDDVFNTFSISEVNNANNKIETTANKIKEKNFSPYEKLMATYLKVASRKYVEETPSQDASISRSLYGVLNSEKIVCVGYSNWLKAIIEALDDPNIKVYTNFVQCSNDNKTFDCYHANVIVSIKDEKYGINGYYYLDPTWDCLDEADKLTKLNLFMLPLQDVDKIYPFVRGVDVELKKINTTKLRPNTNKEDNNFYTKDPPYVSFSTDGFISNPQFMKDFLSRNPNLYNEIVSLYCKTVVLNKLTKVIDKASGEIDIVKMVMSRFQNANVSYISRTDAFILNVGINSAIRNNEINELNSVINTILAKYPAEKYDDTLLDNLYQKINDGINKNCDRLLEQISGRKKLADSLKLKESLTDAEKNAIVKLESEIEKSTKNIDLKRVNAKQFLDGLKNLLDHNNSLAEVFVKLDPLKHFADRFIQLTGTIQINAEELVDKAEKILLDGCDDNIFLSLSKKIADIENRIEAEKINAKKQINDALKNYSAEQVYSGEFNLTDTNDVVYKAILKSSKPVEMAKIKSALKVVLSKTTLNTKTDQIDNEIDKLVLFNSKRAKTIFGNKSCNAFFINGTENKIKETKLNEK